MNAKLEKLSEFYKKQMLSKDSEIKKLHSYIAQLEAAENSIRREFASQLSEKDREIAKTLGLLKSGSKKSSVEALYGEKLSEKDREIERLKAQAAQVKPDFSSVEAEKDQVRRMISLLRAKEAENSRLASQLDERMRTEREYVEKIKSAIARKGQSTNELLRNLTGELNRKTSEVERLRGMLLAQEKVGRQLDNQTLQDKKRIQYLEAFLGEKDLLREKLELSFSQKFHEKERELEQLSRNLKSQLAHHDSARLAEEVASLKAKLKVRESESAELTGQYAELKEQNELMGRRLQERQRLFVESEAAYNKIIAAIQQQHDSRIRELLRKRAETEAQLKAEVEKLRVEVREKEYAVSEKSSRIDETLLQFAETARKLIELKGPEFTAATATAEHTKAKEEALDKRESELNKLLSQATERIKEALRREAQVAKRETMLIKEQEALNSELEVLKKAGIAIGMEKDYLKEKIYQYGQPKAEAEPAPYAEAAQALPEAETRATIAVEERPAAEAVESLAPEAEAEMPIDEKQDALSILRKASKTGARISEDDFLKPAPAREPKQPKLAARKGVFRQAKLKSKILPKPLPKSFKAKVERPKIKEALVKQAEKQDAFPEAAGYGEIDEIKSIISIGLQHNDSIGQIRASLESSGYSKKNIDKAFSEVKEIKASR